jgi:hypothetical protein
MDIYFLEAKGKEPIDYGKSIKWKGKLVLFYG